MEYINPIWGTLQNHQWGENHSTARTYDMICGQVWNGNPFDSQYMTAQAVPEYIGKAPEETVQRILYLGSDVKSPCVSPHLCMVRGMAIPGVFLVL